MESIYDFSITTPDGGQQPLDAYRGQVILIVNVATRCGFTPQTAELETLYETYRDDGFVVLGIPSDEFGGQTPEDDAGAVCFLQDRYSVTFPLFAKTRVNGPEESPLYAFLKRERGGLLSPAVKWNFTKFLVGRDGAVRGRFAPTTKPKTIEVEIKKALAEKTS